MLRSKIALGLGWLRAVAQYYIYNYSKVELCSNFQRNLKVWKVKWSWGLDGGARRRKVTITVTIKLSRGIVFKGI